MIKYTSLGGKTYEEIGGFYKLWTGKGYNGKYITSNLLHIGATDNGRLVGVAELVVISDPFFGRHWGLVENVFVHPNYRGQGIGKELMRAIEVQAKLMGCEFIKLTTRKELGRKLYESLGYEKGTSYYKKLAWPTATEDNGSIKVAVAGAFDILHEGHIDHLEKAAKLGNYIIAIIGSDRFVEGNKGRRPLPLKTRMAVLGPWVDGIVVADGPDGTVADVLRKVKPDIFARGGDRTGDNMPQAEIDACKEIGCRIVYGVGDLLNSSTKLRGLVEA